VDDVT
jgi:hypothetical protein